MTVLQKKGLNTPKAMCSTDYPDFKESDVSWYFPKKYYPKLSIRCFVSGVSVGMVDTPHFPNLEHDVAVVKAVELKRQGFEVLVQEGIDPSDCLLCGTCWVKSNGLVWLDLVQGPGKTVRRVVVEGKPEVTILYNPVTKSVDERYSDDSFCTGELPIIDRVVRRVIEVVSETGLKSVVFEWSFYVKPIGCFEDPLIFWEFTSDGDKT
jgi:hypothetical protein